MKPWLQRTQASFRKILKAMAHPGNTVVLSPELEGVGAEIPLEPMVTLLARTLLDPDTSFSVVGSDTEHWGKRINRLTYCKQERPDASAFILGHLENGSEAFLEGIQSSNSGTLVDPHLGATLLFQVHHWAGEKVKITGPGIDGENVVTLPECSTWVKALKEKNREFPLGVDVLFFTAEGEVRCFPRTTRMEVL